MSLSCEGVTAEYAGRAVLREVTVSLSAGEILGLIGPNGAGKSTLLRVLSGLRKPQNGEVTLDGLPLDRFSGRERARRISLVVQSGDVGFPFTVRELVSQGRYPHLGPFQEMDSAGAVAVDRALADTGLSSLEQRGLETLSLGERQRAWLARGLAQEADVILLDEPAAHLDAGFEAIFAGVLRRRAREGRAVICAVHDLNLAARLCDRLALLCDGRLLAVASPEEVLEAGRLQKAFGGNPGVQRGADGLPVVIFRPEGGRP